MLVEWLATFRRSLELRLSQLLGTTPQVLPEIHSLLPTDSASADTNDPDLMLLVISPGCFDAVSFVARAQRFRDAHTDTSSLIRIVAAPVDQSREPAWFSDLPEYDLSDGLDKSYWARLGDLAYRLVEVAEKLDPAIVDPTAGATPANFPVYLADTPSGLEREREMIRRVIERNGITLLETTPGRRSTLELEELVRRQIGLSALSIHMLPASDDSGATVGRDTLVGIELAQAADRCRSDRSFSQLIWIPPTLESATTFPADRFFLQNGEMAGEVDLLRISIEDLKTRIGDRIKRARDLPAPIEAPAAADGAPSVYLMFDPRDADDARPLSDFLGHQGLEVILPCMQGDRVQMREHHQQSLRICTAAMIYYGRVNEPWVRIKQQDLQKSAGFGRSMPMSGSAIFMGPDPTPSKQGFTAGGVTVIHSVDGFLPESVRPFLERIQG